MPDHPKRGELLNIGGRLMRVLAVDDLPDGLRLTLEHCDLEHHPDDGCGHHHIDITTYDSGVTTLSAGTPIVPTDQRDRLLDAVGAWIDARNAMATPVPTSRHDDRGRRPGLGARMDRLATAEAEMRAAYYVCVDDGAEEAADG